ncbi:MAG: hypothetical protein ACRYGK_17800 [Janthinobacterium lividum]
MHELLEINDLLMQRCLVELGVDFTPVLTRSQNQAYHDYLKTQIRRDRNNYTLRNLSTQELEQEYAKSLKRPIYWYSHDFALRDWSIHRQLLEHPQADTLSAFSDSPSKTFSDFYTDKLFTRPATERESLPERNEAFSPEKDPGFLGSFQFKRQKNHDKDIFAAANVDISSRIWEALFKITTAATSFAMFKASSGVKEQQIKALTACMLANLQQYMDGETDIYPHDCQGFSPDVPAKLLELEQRQKNALVDLGLDGLNELSAYLANITIIDDCLAALARVVDDDSAEDLHDGQTRQPDRAALEKNLLEVVTARSGYSDGLCAFLIRCTLDAIHECDGQATGTTIPGHLTFRQQQTMLAQVRRARVERILVDKLKERISGREFFLEIASERTLPWFEQVFHQFICWQFDMLNRFIDAMQAHLEQRDGNQRHGGNTPQKN